MICGRMGLIMRASVSLSGTFMRLPAAAVCHGATSVFAIGHARRVGRLGVGAVLVARKAADREQRAAPQQRVALAVAVHHRAQRSVVFAAKVEFTEYDVFFSILKIIIVDINNIDY